MPSLQFELTKRSIKGKQYSICISCLNEMLLKYDRDTSINKILSYLDNDFTEIEILFDNLFDICIYIAIAREKIPDCYIDRFIENLSLNNIIETMDRKFMGKFGETISGYRNRTVDYCKIIRIVSNYCENPNDSNIVMCLNEFDILTNINGIRNSDVHIDECIEYFARCNVYNEQPVYSDVMEMINSFIQSKVTFPTYYHMEMTNMCKLLRKSLYSPTTDSLHMLFQHSFFEKSKMSCGSKFLYYRKKYEEQHVKETVEKIKYSLINEESKIIEIEKTLYTLKMKMTNLTEEEIELFKKINQLLIEVMISIKNQMV